jgi:peptidoglycan/xylan/chitin deacetylase (PgdA/CDA1 family)
MTACITLDLEPDYGGRLAPTYTAWDPHRVEGLLTLLAAHGAPLTVFVVGESLSAQPRVIERMRSRGAEFHLHSFSHDLAQPDTLDEIRRGATAFEACFGRRPEGYRAPEGRISPAGWSRLEDEGFLFDSSVFPSFWPAARYLRFSPRPFRPEGRRLLELPISTVTPGRLIVSLSWMKLLGWEFYRRLLENADLPEPIVFDMHLHDLWETPSFDQLRAPWRWIYRRNRGGGLRILEAFLGLLARRGHRLTTLGAVARSLAGVPC